jgi:phenol hydroxylase P1 protein
MTVEIKTTAVEPIRQNFGTVARRFGADKAVSRYQEASFDLQAQDNFHYRPVWDPAREIYDRRRTAVQMADWEVFKDPRQFYYASYCIQRARMQEAAEKSFDFVEKNQLIGLMAEPVRQRAEALLPLRHAEWAANQHNCFVTAYGFGSSITQGAMYAATDRLAIAQYLSRIGLLLDGSSGRALDAAKRQWLEDTAWQPLRRLCEDLLVRKDWFELLVAQDLVIDGLLHPLAFGRPAGTLAEPGAATLAMLTEFIEDWFPENRKWVDACVAAAAGESAANRALIAGWVKDWSARAVAAIAPLVPLLQGEAGAALWDQAQAAWQARIAKLGLAPA